MENTIIEFKHVKKFYEKKEVLHDFNLEVKQGEFITIIGSSGCGKTTALKMINALHLPDGGEVIVSGKEIRNSNPIILRRSIGYAIQNSGLFPHMNIYHNISYVLKLQKIHKKQIENKVYELIHLLGLEEDMLRRYPHELSGGQQQRVGIARALAGSPKIMLMDEPFGAVDAITRKKLQKEIKRIQQELKITILFVTHDIQEAMMLGDRILIMDQGNIIQYDTKENIADHPSTSFIKELISPYGYISK